MHFQQFIIIFVWGGGGGAANFGFGAANNWKHLNVTAWSGTQLKKEKVNLEA